MHATSVQCDDDDDDALVLYHPIDNSHSRQVPAALRRVTPTTLKGN